MSTAFTKRPHMSRTRLRALLEVNARYAVAHVDRRGYTEQLERVARHRAAHTDDVTFARAGGDHEVEARARTIVFGLRVDNERVISAVFEHGKKPLHRNGFSATSLREALWRKGNT